MSVEIERKFLVTGDGFRTEDPQTITQGYLSFDKHRTVRVRVSGADGYLTIKGLTVGASRMEFEYRIPHTDAEELRLPDWAGAEVTEDPRYANSNLALRPYSTWSD